MDKVELKNRTKRFAVDIIKFVDELLAGIDGRNRVGKFKHDISSEKEANELTAIFTAISKTAKANQRAAKSENKNK